MIIVINENINKGFLILKNNNSNNNICRLIKIILIILIWMHFQFGYYINYYKVNHNNF